jgi:hypothetical protein
VAASSTRAATPHYPGRGYRGGLSRGPMPSVQHCLDIACGLGTTPLPLMMPPPLLLCACASRNPTRQIVLICSEFFLRLCNFCYCDSALAIACNRSLIQTGHLPGSKKNQCMQLSQPFLWPFFRMTYAFDTVQAVQAHRQELELNLSTLNTVNMILPALSRPP